MSISSILEGLNASRNNISEAAKLEDSYEVKRSGFRYRVGFYTDTKTGEGTTQITRISPYDMTEYHYAISSDGQNFGLYRNGKVVKKIKLRFEEMSMGDVNMLVDTLIDLDKKAGLTSRIDRT